MVHKKILNDIDTILAEPQPPGDAVLAVMRYIKSLRSDFHWVGVYLLKNNELVVGPYVGPTTDHVRIKIGQGVCGRAVAEDANQIVDDVRSDTNYLACNLETRSEIVTLIRDAQSKKIIGQIDIDSKKLNAFSTEDEKLFVAIGAKLAPLLKII